MPWPTVPPGRLLERRGDAAPRGMTVALRSRSEQNPAYRTAPLFLSARSRAERKSSAASSLRDEAPTRVARRSADSSSRLPAAVAAAPSDSEGAPSDPNVRCHVLEPRFSEERAPPLRPCGTKHRRALRAGRRIHHPDSPRLSPPPPLTQRGLRRTPTFAAMFSSRASRKNGLRRFLRAGRRTDARCAPVGGFIIQTPRGCLRRRRLGGGRRFPASLWLPRLALSTVLRRSTRARAPVAGSDGRIRSSVKISFRENSGKSELPQ
jgi:hypothetical protein